MELDAEQDDVSSVLGLLLDTLAAILSLVVVAILLLFDRFSRFRIRISVAIDLLLPTRP